MDGYVTLASYCKTAVRDPDSVRRALLRGELAGQQDAAGRWWVSRADFERAELRKRAHDAAVASTTQLRDERLRTLAVAYRLAAFDAEIALSAIEARVHEAELCGDWPLALDARELAAEFRGTARIGVRITVPGAEIGAETGSVTMERR